MENLQQKADFLRNEYTALLSQLDSNAPRKWGKMDVQQMIEHMSDYVRIANGRTPMEIVTPDDKLPLMQGFLATEKPFRENTPRDKLLYFLPLPQGQGSLRPILGPACTGVRVLLPALYTYHAHLLHNPVLQRLSRLCSSASGSCPFAAGGLCWPAVAASCIGMPARSRNETMLRLVSSIICLKRLNASNL
jgi:hypothetical protein